MTGETLAGGGFVPPSDFYETSDMMTAVVLSISLGMPSDTDIIARNGIAYFRFADKDRCQEILANGNDLIMRVVNTYQHLVAMTHRIKK